MHCHLFIMLMIITIIITAVPICLLQNEGLFMMSPRIQCQAWVVNQIMGPCRIIFFCKTRALRGIQQHSPACLTTACRKSLLQTPPSVQRTCSGPCFGHCLPRKYPSVSSSSISRTLNIKMNIYFQCPTNVPFPASVRIHRNYIMSEYGYKVNTNLPLPLFLARSSERLGTQKEESEHAETLGQRE